MHVIEQIYSALLADKNLVKIQRVAGLPALSFNKYQESEFRTVLLQVNYEVTVRLKVPGRDSDCIVPGSYY